MRGGLNFLLARSSISIARSRSTSAGKPVSRMTRRKRAVRRAPNNFASSTVKEFVIVDDFLLAMRVLVVVEGGVITHPRSQEVRHAERLSIPVHPPHE